MIEALNDYVVIREIKKEEEIVSGIILPKIDTNIIIGVNKDGDKVVFSKYDGIAINDTDNEEYLLVKQEKLLAIIK